MGGGGAAEYWRGGGGGEGGAREVGGEWRRGVGEGKEGRQREEVERMSREVEAVERERRQKNIMDDVERIRRNYIQKVLFNASFSNRRGF